MDFYYAYAYVPAGVICLMSAAVYYNLTTYRPDVVDVAIERKAKVSTVQRLLQPVYQQGLQMGCNREQYIDKTGKCWHYSR